jgi:sugar (pentulose or hexulose) kinase
VGVGMYKSIDQAASLVKIVDTIAPIEENAAVYDRLYGIYRRLYQQVKPLYPRETHEKN